MKICFLGGSFDPPHKGHLAIARKCLTFCDLFLFIPAYQSPLKKHEPISNGIQRSTMLELMFSGIDNCMIDTFELNYTGPSYTLNTIHHLQAKYPDDELSLVLGLDQITNFSNWYRYEEILKNVKVVCFNRDSGGNIPEQFQDRIQLIPDFSWKISSTKLREQLAGRNPAAADDLHSAVYNYILRHELYL